MTIYWAVEGIPMKNNNDSNMLKKAHWSLWVVGLAAFIWHGLGLFNLAMQLNPDVLTHMPDSHRAIAESRPVWVTIVFALSVLNGAIGGVHLLLKMKFASSSFLISLLAAVVAILHAIIKGDALSIFSPFEISMAIIGPLIAGGGFLWYSIKAKKKLWIS